MKKTVHAQEDSAPARQRQTHRNNLWSIFLGHVENVTRKMSRRDIWSAERKHAR